MNLYDAPESSSQFLAWDTKYHFDAMIESIDKSRQSLTDNLVSRLAKLTEQLESLNTQKASPPPPRAQRQTARSTTSYQPESFEEFLRTYVPPTRPASRVQSAIVPSSLACDEKCPIYPVHKEELKQPPIDAKSKEEPAEVEEEEVEINVTVKEVEVIEKLLEIQSCYEKDNDIREAMVEDHEELEQASMADPSSSNIFCQPFSCDVFILQVVKMFQWKLKYH